MKVTYEFPKEYNIKTSDIFSMSPTSTSFRDGWEPVEIRFKNSKEVMSMLRELQPRLQLIGSEDEFRIGVKFEYDDFIESWMIDVGTLLQINFGGTDWETNPKIPSMVVIPKNVKIVVE